MEKTNVNMRYKNECSDWVEPDSVLNNSMNLRGMKVYISGPITGLPYEEVEEKFNDASLRLEEIGFSEIVNPIDNGISKESTWEKHMRADLKLLLDCDAIYMLKGWENSKGAKLEHHIAGKLGMTIIQQIK